MPNAKQFQLDGWINLVSFVVAFMLLTHFVASMFIFIGHLDINSPEEDRMSWLSVPGNQFEDQSWHYVYVFAYYWIFEVVTTVGYGEFTGSTKTEQLYSIFVEFLGVTFIALLLGFLGKAIGHDVTFDGFITERLDVIDNWALKLEKSNKPKFLHSKLYS
jgi:Ion transport protein